MAGQAPQEPVLQAVVEAVGEEDDRLGGHLSTLLSAPLTRTEVGQIHVTTTIGFRPAGTLAVEGEVIAYAGISPTAFLTLQRGQPGRNGAQTLPADHSAVGTPVFDLTRQHSAVDLLRRAMVVDFAQDRDLDRLGRNFGLPRPDLVLGDDPNFRVYVKRRALAPATTGQNIRAVLDSLIHGRWSHAVWEDPRRPGEVFIEFGAIPGFDKLKGKTFLNSAEVRTATGFTTVTTAYPIGRVLGVWLSSDAQRTGRNYWNFVNTNAQVAVAVPGEIVIPSGLVTADAGRVIQLRGGTTALTDGPHYRIETVNTVGGKVQVHALTLPTTTRGGVNDGLPVPPVEGGPPIWTATEGNVTAEIFDGGSFSGSAITLRGSLPASNSEVAVDYGAFLSAQILRYDLTKNTGAPGSTYWPAHLGGGGAEVMCVTIHDLVAAGVIVNCRIATG